MDRTEPPQHEGRACRWHRRVDRRTLAPGCNGTSADGDGVCPNQPATPNRTVRIPDELWEAARAKAEAEGVTLTEIIRRALERFLRD